MQKSLKTSAFLSSKRRFNAIDSVCRLVIEPLERRIMLTGIPITSGQTIAGTITTAGQQDTYTFTATAGQTFIADVGDATSTSVYQPYVSVFDPSGTPAGSGSGYYSGTGYAGDYRTNTSAEVTVSAATAGTYRIVVQDRGGTETGGTYDLEVAAAPATQTADADGNGGAIASGQTKAGTINHFGDLDVYTFTAAAGQTFIADIGDATSSSAYQPYMNVYDPSGTPAGSGSGYYYGTGYAGDYRTNTSAKVTVSAASAGSYTIVVQDRAGAETGGTYDLEVAAAPATQAADADGDGGKITSGQTKAGTINHYGDLDIYTFTAAAGQTFIADLGDATSSSAYQPYVNVYDPSGAPAGSGSGYYYGTGYAGDYRNSTSAEVTVSAANAGTYTIVVQDRAGAETGGTYDLEVAAAPATQAPDADGNGGTISSGQTKNGTIGRPGDLDVFTFTATAGQTFELSLGAASSASTFLPQLQIYNPAGTQVYNASSSSLSSSVRGTYNVPSTDGGTYTAIVQGYGATNVGAYTVELAAAPATQAADSGGNGGPILSGQTKAGTIGRPGDLDVFTFSAAAGQTFSASVGDATSTSTYAPNLIIYGPNGALAGSGYGYNNGTGYADDPRTQHSVGVVVYTATAGTYTIIVQDYSGNETGGSYDLEVDAAPATQAADSDGDGGVITSGQTKAGTINHYGDLDVYTFAATAGETIIAGVGDATSVSTYAPDLTVYGPNGALAGNGYGYNSGTGFANDPRTQHSAEVIVTAAAAGTYTIIVQDYSGNETGGSYDLEVDAAPATQAADSNGDGGTITSGQTKAGTVNHFGDLDVYTFAATAGETITANVGDATSDSTYHPQLSVYDPNGAPAGAGYGYNSGTGYADDPRTQQSAEVIVSAATAGNYTIIVQDYGGATVGGAYDLEVDGAPATQAADADGDGGAITSGQTKAATINHFGDLDVYTFTATAGETITADVGDATSDSTYHPQLSVYDPNGAPAGAGYGYYSGTGYADDPRTQHSAEVIVSAATAGNYTIVVQDYGGATVGGAYDLEVDGAPATQAADADGDGGTITSGQTKAGTINHYGDLDVYTFTAAAGETINAGVEDATPTSAFEPELHLYGPDGALAGNGYGYNNGTGFAGSPSTNTSAGVVASVATAGTYTIVVQDYGGGEVGGAYDVEMIKAPTTGPITPTSLPLDTPVIGRINTSGENDSWTFFGRAGQSVSVLLNPTTGYAANFLGAFSPVLNYGSVSLIAPDGSTVLGTQNATAAGQVLTVNGVKLPTDGIYTISVNAATGFSTATGNYVVGVFNSTPNAQTLDLNKSVVGNITTPFDYDQYTFSATANTQVQLQLASGSSSSLSYTLTGPNGAIIFSNVTASTALINLPTDGAYTLTVQGANGQAGKYGFTLLKTNQTSLALGTMYTGSATGSDQAQLFAIPITSADPISIALSDANTSDHNELYASFNQPPTCAAYDYGISGAGAGQSLLIPSSKPGTLYVLVYNESVASPPATYTLLVQSAHAVLSSAAPATGVTTAATTLTLQGAGFTAGAVVSLVSSGGTKYAASSSVVDLPTQMTATFAAGSVPAGTYAVQVAENGTTTQLAAAFTMVASGTGTLTTNLEIPNPIGNHIAATLYVDYSNTGTAAIAAPLLTLDASRPSADGSTQLHGAFMTLDPTLITSGYWTSATPAGYSSSVEILAQGNTPGVLQPGESERIPVYYAGWLQSQWNFNDPTINFSLSAVQPTDTTAVNWSSTLAGLQPATIGTAAWSAISSNLLAKLGTTAGSYVQMLDNSATYLGRLGENVSDIQSLWGFELQQADDGVSAIGPTLTSAADDSVTAPGASITFGRSFSSSITGRDTLGILGYGWSTPWEAHALIDSDGTATIFGGGDSEEVFQPDSRYAGVYFSSTGDHNKLTADGAGGYLLTAPDGSLTDFSSGGALHYIQDTDGNRITAGYTSNQLSSLTHSSGQSLSIAYNSNGLISSITDSTGRTTSYTYNAAEQLTTVKDYAGRTTSYAYSTATSGAAQNELTTITSPGGLHSYFTYDAQGRLAGTHADGNAEANSFSYSEGGVTTTDSLGDASTEYFDDNGLLAKSVDPLGNATYASYDQSFNLVKTTGSTGLTENYAYDGNGNVTALNDSLGNTTKFAYGSDSRLTALTDARGNTTGYSYNATGDLLSTAYADGTSSTSTFNPLGEPVSFLNQNSQAITYNYNTAGQLTKEGFADGTSYAYTYDAHGNLLTAVDATGTTTFTYDSKDELTEVVYPGSLYLKFTYNADGQRTQMVDQTGFTTNYQYDTAGRLSGLTDGSGAAVVTYTYDAVGRLSKKVNGNGTSTTYAYDADSNVLHLINYAPNGTTVNSRFDYTYDALGKVATEATIDGTWTYTYDGDGQLTHAVFASTDSNIANQDLTYNYDAVGNRTSTVINGVTTTYTVNSMNEYTSVGGITYSYDKDGNLISNGVTTDSYDSLNRTTNSLTSGVTTNYVFNALGQRVSTTSAGVTTGFDYDPTGGLIADEISTAGIMHEVVGYGLTAAVTAGAEQYFDFDNMGSTAGVSGSTGTYADSYSYRPFGDLLQSSGSGAQVQTFDASMGAIAAASGSYIMSARLYDPTTGRFQSADSINIGGGDPNFYRFAKNSPTNFVDPSGHVITVAAAVVGAIAGGVIGGAGYWVEHLVTGKDFSWQEFGGDVTGGAIAGGLAGLTGGASLLIDGTGIIAVEAAGAELTAGAAAFYSAIGSEYGYLIGHFNNDFKPAEFVESIAFGAIGGSFSKTIERLGNAAVEEAFHYADGALLENIYSNVELYRLLAGKTLDTLNDLLGRLAQNLLSAVIKAVNSHDPNAKIGPSGYGTANYVADAGSFPYNIEFENGSSATAPAQEVNITDQLSPNLNWSTFQLSQIGFGDTNIIIPAGSQTYQTTVPMTYDGITFNVGVDVGIHTSTGEVYANFFSIDPTTQLPPSVLAGFLPPEDGTGRGQGYISYTVAPKANLANGTQITNVASIVFDGAAPITTDQADDEDPSKGIDTTKQDLVTIDSSPPVSAVSALPPTTTTTSFPVSWSGTDTNSSGVASFTIYDSDNGGAFKPWLTNTALTTSNFTGVAGHTYAFYSVATDNVGNIEAAPASADTQTVVSTVANTKTTLTKSTTAAAVYGQSITFTAATAVVSPGTGTPTGTITFKDGATTLGTAALSAGKATFTTSMLAIGSHTSITAVYAGNANFNASTSGTLTQTVTKSATTTKLTKNTTAATKFGQSVTFTAAPMATSPGAGSPTGTVTFKDGSSTLGTATLISGIATFTTAALAVSSHSITAVYGGDTNFSVSTSSALTQTVSKSATTTQVTKSSTGAISYGQSVTFTATMLAVSPGSGTPTGTVTFMDGTTSLGTAMLSAGKAAFTTTALAVGSHSAITAVYSGDANFTASTSGSLSQTVLPVLFEAEDAALGGTTVALHSHSGYTGSGYADMGDQNSTVQFTVATSGAGSAALIFRYANGSTAARPVTVTINGTVAGTVSFAPTGSWTTWITTTLNATLLSGNNTILLQPTGSDGPNLDSLLVRVPVTYEAENATLGGGTVAAHANAGYTGAGYADFGNQNSTVQFNVTAGAAGAATLTFRYANGSTAARPVSLSVNGTVVSTLSFAPTGSWTTWTTTALSTTLLSGNNVILLTVTGSDGPNLDSLVIS